MSEKPSVWTRLTRWLRPERETYETRVARPGADVTQPPAQYGQSTDQRRHGGSGGSGAIGG